jgi:hypothetical protein
MPQLDVGDYVASIRRDQADYEGQVLEVLSPDTVWVRWGAHNRAWVTECAERADTLVLLSRRGSGPAQKTA